MTKTIGSCPRCKQLDVPLVYHWDAAYWACPACMAKAKLGSPLAAPLPEPSGPQLNSFTSQVEHKILRGEGKSAPAPAVPAAAPAGGTEAGSFVGYLAAVGNRDRQGDTLLPGAADATVEAFRTGASGAWLLTDAHSAKGSDVVAEVRSAAVDAYGVRIEGDWMPTEPAQRLRAMARAGARLGLSMDYLPLAWRPDGAGGRLLDEVGIYGGAVTPIPANERAVILAGKDAGPLPAAVLTVAQDIEAGRAARDPDTDRRRREDEMLAAVSWPPAHFGRETRLALLAGAAQAKAARELAGDPERARARARWERENAYSTALAEWMADH